MLNVISEGLDMNATSAQNAAQKRRGDLRRAERRR
jgi:hypothetical protein